MIVSEIGTEEKVLTLRELCQLLNISRRTVQGYEAQGLVAPSGKTNMGHLVYDAAAQERVRSIRKYQEYGFQLKKIALLLDAPNAVLKVELEARLAELRQESRNMRKAILELEAELDSLKI